MNKKLLIPLSLSLILGSFAIGAYESISNVSISTTSLSENTLSGTEIADLSTIGGESPYTYYLTVSGAGIDNDKFYISGSKLYSNFIPDYENPSDSDANNNYTIEVKSVDNSKPVKYAKDFGRRFFSSGGFYGEDTVSNLIRVSSLMEDGSIYSFGDNRVDSNWVYWTETGFVDVFTNQQEVLGMRADGSVKSFGNTKSALIPAPTDTGFVKIYSTVSAFAGMKADGSIKSWGDIERGGEGAPTETGYTKIATSKSGFAALAPNGSVYSRGSVYTGNQPTDTGFVDVFGNGAGAFAALKSDGSIKAWGSSTYGGTSPTGTGYITIAGNPFAFAALKSDGSIKAWGDTTRGGTSPTGTGFVKIYGGGNAFAALKSDGSIKAWGSSTYGGVGAPSGTGFVRIFAGNRTFSAIRSDGMIYSRGYGAYGGTGAPTRAGYVDIVGNYYTMLALHADGSLYSRGSPTYGGGTVPAGTNFVKIFATQDSLAAIKADGTVVYRGKGDWPNLNPYRMGVSYNQTYNIQVLDEDDTPPIPTLTYTEGIGQVTATLHLNESGVVTNNGGSFEYVFSQTGQFVFEFADLAGNTGSVVASVDRVPGNGGGIVIQKDYCPNGDNSPSYYDTICGTPTSNSSSSQSNGSVTVPSSESTGSNVISGVISNPTWQEVYNRAKTNSLTTMPDFMSARLGDTITRGELAKVMVNYLKNKELDQTKVCQFNDIADQSEEIKASIIKACQMGIMGVNIKDFAPNAYITRGEWSTILSRSLWGDLYENKEGIYYANHIKALKQKGILTNTDAQLQEARGYILLMLMRI